MAPSVPCPSLYQGGTQAIIAPDLTTLELGFDVPALPGMAESDILTPALIIDLDAFEDNVERMRSLCASHSVRHRAQNA
jgi:hypothetical protein